MKRDIGFTKIRRRVLARAAKEEAGQGMRDKAGLKAAEAAGACTGKERFASHAMANAVVSRKKGKRHCARQVYACKSCGGYHLGSHTF